MEISSFSDIEGLLFCFNASDLSTIDKTGNVINSVTSSEGSESVTLTQTTATTNYIEHDGTTTVGSALAFVGGATDDDRGLTSGSTITDGDLSTGVTFGVLEHRNDKWTDYSYVASEGTSLREGLLTRGSPDQWQVNLSASIIDVDPVLAHDTFLPRAIVCRHSGTRESLQFHYDGLSVHGLAFTGSITGTFDRISLMNSPTGDQRCRKNTAIVVCYNRKLDDTETAALLTLLQYWKDNGEAPAPSIPTTATFGPVSTNQDGDVTSWQWQESANNTDWAPVGTILTQTTGGNTNELTVTRATVDMHQTYVRCEAQTATQTTHSDSAQLLIDGEPV